MTIRLTDYVKEGINPVVTNTVDPISSDDGYSVGTSWYNSNNETIWFCSGNNTGAATWDKVDKDHNELTLPQGGTTNEYYHLTNTQHDFLTTMNGEPSGYASLDGDGLVPKDQLPSTAPVGQITPFMGGYFTGSSNTGFTNVIGNDASSVNILLNSSGWFVCDGATLNDPLSPIFNGVDRYLPNLSDDRFLMGDTAAGVTGGDNVMAHTHTGPSHTHTGPNHRHTGPSHTHSVYHNHGAFTSGGRSLSVANLANHNHGMDLVNGTSSGNSYNQISSSTNTVHQTTGYTYYAGSNTSHTHTVDPGGITVTSGAGGTGYTSYYSGTTGSGGTGTTGSGGTGTTSAASNTENRPKFVSCLYIMKVR